jgi:hypothetical protein
VKICRETRRLLERSFEGRLALEEDFRIEDHVRDCAACRVLYGQSRALQDALLDLPAPPVERLDIERCLRAVGDGIDASAAGDSGVRSKRVAAGAIAIAIGAGILVALAWGWTLLAGSEPGALDPGTGRARGRENGAEQAALPPAPSPEPDLAGDLPAAEPFADTGVDSDRLADARAAVREVLVAASSRLPAGGDAPECAAFVQECDQGLQPWVARGWPVQHIVAGLIRSDDAGLARAGMRYLGLRGGRSCVSAIVDGLARLECKRAAARALIDRGDARGLARAVWDADLQSLVMEHLLLSEQGLDWWRDAIDVAPRGSQQVHDLAAGLLPGLIAAGEPGAREMIARWKDGPFLEADLLDALARTQGAQQAIIDAILALGPLDDDAFLLNAVERLKPPQALAWLASVADDRRKRVRALDVIAGFAGADALGLLLDLLQDDEDSLRAWRRAVGADDSRRLSTLADELVAFGRLADARRMLDLCIRSELPDAVPAILVLARSRLFSVEERALALLAVGASAREEHIEGLRRLFGALESHEGKVAAAALVTLHAVGGSDATLSLIGVGSESRRKRLRTRLDRAAEGRGAALALFELAHELEGVLGSARTESWRNVQ